MQGAIVLLAAAQHAHGRRLGRISGRHERVAVVGEHQVAVVGVAGDVVDDDAVDGVVAAVEALRGLAVAFVFIHAWLQLHGVAEADVGVLLARDEGGAQGSGGRGCEKEGGAREEEGEGGHGEWWWRFGFG